MQEALSELYNGKEGQLDTFFEQLDELVDQLDQSLESASSSSFQAASPASQVLRSLSESLCDDAASPLSHTMMQHSGVATPLDRPCISMAQLMSITPVILSPALPLRLPSVCSPSTNMSRTTVPTSAAAKKAKKTCM